MVLNSLEVEITLILIIILCDSIMYQNRYDRDTSRDRSRDRDRRYHNKSPSEDSN